MWCSSGGGWGRRVTTSSTTTTTWSGGGGPKTSDITDIGTPSNAGSGWLVCLEMLLAWCAWCDVVACHFLIFEFCELRCDGWRTFWDGHLDLIQSKFSGCQIFWLKRKRHQQEVFWKHHLKQLKNDHESRYLSSSRPMRAMSGVMESPWADLSI